MSIGALQPEATAAADEPPRSPSSARRRADRLLDRRNDRVAQSQQLAAAFGNLNGYLAVGEKVTAALEQLSDKLFQELLNVVQEKLTLALQEILDQPLKFRAEAGFKRNAATVDFSIERNGEQEDLYRGQGGSVANILSVGLRMFALTTLDPAEHRRFLVLDEQDCWLRPDLVPKLVKIVHDAGQAPGFQVLMISHHDIALFEQYADRIYQFVPAADGRVDVRLIAAAPAEADAE